MNSEILTNSIGENLKRIRNNRNLSLDETSSLTGVSKPMLGQIESGLSTPTITTLWKIATGLKTPLSSFLESPQSEYQLSEIKDKTVIEEENGTMRAYTLFPYSPIRNIEIFFIEFDTGCQHFSEKHNDGVEEYILIVSGSITMVLGGEKITVSMGQSLRFRADVPHGYCNTAPEKCCVYNIIFYPK